MRDLEKLNAILQKQIDDPLLWMVNNNSAVEQHLQLQLRILHAAVEIYVFERKNITNERILKYEQ